MTARDLALKVKANEVIKLSELLKIVRDYSVIFYDPTDPREICFVDTSVSKYGAIVPVHYCLKQKYFDRADENRLIAELIKSQKETAKKIYYKLPAVMAWQWPKDRYKTFPSILANYLNYITDVCGYDNVKELSTLYKLNAYIAKKRSFYSQFAGLDERWIPQSITRDGSALQIDLKYRTYTDENPQDYETCKKQLVPSDALQEMAEKLVARPYSIDLDCKKLPPDVYRIELDRKLFMVEYREHCVRLSYELQDVIGRPISTIKKEKAKKTDMKELLPANTHYYRSARLIADQSNQAVVDLMSFLTKTKTYQNLVCVRYVDRIYQTYEVLAPIKGFYPNTSPVLEKADLINHEITVIAYTAPMHAGRGLNVNSKMITYCGDDPASVKQQVAKIAYQELSKLLKHSGDLTAFEEHFSNTNDGHIELLNFMTRMSIKKPRLSKIDIINAFPFNVVSRFHYPKRTTQAELKYHTMVGAPILEYEDGEHQDVMKASKKHPIFDWIHINISLVEFEKVYPLSLRIKDGEGMRFFVKAYEQKLKEMAVDAIAGDERFQMCGVPVNCLKLDDARLCNDGIIRFTFSLKALSI